MNTKIYLLILAFIVIICGCKKNNILLTTTSDNSKTKKITIWVHGTKTVTELIPKYFHVPQGLNKSENIDPKYYIKEMTQLLCAVEPNNFKYNDFYTFGWSGGLGNNYRNEAAQDLYKAIVDLLNKYKQQGLDVELTIITHSHGGNVALNLAKIANLSDNKFLIDKLILLACPVQNETKNFINHEMFKKIYSIYSKIDLLQVIDPQGLQKENKNKQVPFFSQRRFDVCDKLKQAKVKINGRAIMHVEFLGRKFLKMLPKLITLMDDIVCDKKEVLIKVDFKKNKIQNLTVK